MAKDHIKLNFEDLEFDPDDEELDQTPPDVVDILGFDPREFDEGEEPVDNWEE